MPRASKPQPTEPTGPRLVRKTTAKPTPPTPLAPSTEEIATRAYELFLQEGCQHGHHLEHWLKAERELMEVVAVLPAKKVASTRARR